MSALSKNAISVTVIDRAKQTKIWDHKGNKTQLTNIFKNSKFYKKKSKYIEQNGQIFVITWVTLGKMTNNFKI